MLNIAVAPESRKKGYAARLLGHAIAHLRRAGRKEFFLEVREGNADAIRLYREAGVQEDRQEEEILHGDERGRPRDAS